MLFFADHILLADKKIGAQQVIGNIDGWKIHLTGLLKIIGVRTETSIAPDSHWIAHSVQRYALPIYRHP